jgi:hypothetical protein
MAVLSEITGWQAAGVYIYIPLPLATHEYVILGLAKLPFGECEKSLSLRYQLGSQ